jgi:hypothetical protein
VVERGADNRTPLGCDYLGEGIGKGCLAGGVDAVNRHANGMSEANGGDASGEMAEQL